MLEVKNEEEPETEKWATKLAKVKVRLEQSETHLAIYEAQLADLPLPHPTSPATTTQPDFNPML